MINVRTENLITKVVKKTGRELVVRAAMSTPALQDVCINQLTAVRGIILMVNAVLLLRLPDVRRIIKSPVILPVVLPVPIPAVIPVTDVVPMFVLPEHLRIIMVLTAERLNAVLLVIVVKTVLQAAGLIPVLMLDLLNAEVVMLVPTPVAQVRSPYLVLLIM